MLRINSHRLSCALLGAAFAISTVLVPHAVEAQAGIHNPSRGASSKVLVQAPVNTTSGAAAGTFTGVLNITNFAVQNGHITATGLLTGTINDLNGNKLQTVSQSVTTLLTGASASCGILNLTLGPLHLDLLGLVVDLNQIHLNIVAVPGPGNLLGNLLCDVANLLNNGGSLASIVSDLNMILKGLGL